jgi:hypothetical protein
MAAGAWVVYDQFKLKLGKKIMSLNAADTINMALFLSTSNVGSESLATATYGAATNEVATAYGYTATGVICAATYTNAAGVETFTVANAVWNASGGSITARFAVLYDATTGDLIAYCLLDSTPADVTVTTGNSLTVAINASGVFTLT